jgi:hypothetical protein
VCIYIYISYTGGVSRSVWLRASSARWLGCVYVCLCVGLIWLTCARITYTCVCFTHVCMFHTHVYVAHTCVYFHTCVYSHTCLCCTHMCMFHIHVYVAHTCVYSHTCVCFTHMCMRKLHFTYMCMRKLHVYVQIAKCISNLPLMKDKAVLDRYIAHAYVCVSYLAYVCFKYSTYICLAQQKRRTRQWRIDTAIYEYA